MDRVRSGPIPARSALRDPGRRRGRSAVAGGVVTRPRSRSPISSSGLVGTVQRRRSASCSDGDSATRPPTGRSRPCWRAPRGRHRSAVGAGHVPGAHRVGGVPGSLIRGAQAAQRAASRADPGPLFLRPRSGMRELVDALAATVGSASGRVSRLQVSRTEGSTSRTAPRSTSTPSCSRVARSPRHPCSGRARRRGSRPSAPSPPAWCSSCIPSEPREPCPTGPASSSRAGPPR